MIQQQQQPDSGSVADHAHYTSRTFAALRSLLEAEARRPSSAGAVRPALKALCGEARTSEMRVEQLIVLLKEVWNSLPETSAFDARTKQERLDRLVTMCVQEYYAR